jgi:hypothetical protein
MTGSDGAVSGTRVLYALSQFKRIGHNSSREKRARTWNSRSSLSVAASCCSRRWMWSWMNCTATKRNVIALFALRRDRRVARERSALATVEHTRTVAPFRIAADAHRIGPRAHRPRLCRARTGKPSLSHYSLRQVCRGDIATICCCRQLNCATSHPRTTSDRNSKRTALRCDTRDWTAPPPALAFRAGTCSRGLPKNILPSAASTPGGACVGIPGLMSFGNVVTSFGAWPSPIALMHSRVPQR